MARTPRFPFRFARRPATDRRQRRRTLNLQSLEDRSVPATAISVASNVFTIANTDNLSVSIQVERISNVYTLHITGDTFTNNAGGRVTIAADGTAMLNGTVSGLVFNLGDGNDTLTAGGGSLDTFTAPVTVDGGDDSDTLVVDDSTDDDANTYGISAAVVVRNTGIFTVNHGAMEQISLAAGTDDDVINLNSVNQAIDITVAGGGGDDELAINDTGNAAIDYTITGTTIERGTGTITYGTFEDITLNATDGANTITIKSDTADTVFGPITVDGGTGTNDLIIDDAVVTADRTYGIASGQVTRTDNGTVSFSLISSVEVTAGSGNDSIAITSTLLTRPVTVNSGDGNDTVTAGNGSLDGLAGSLTLDPGLGSDTLVVDDSTDSTNPNRYTIDATTVARTTLPTRSFGYAAKPFDAVVLKAGTRTERITVSDTAPNTAFTVNTGNDGVEVLVKATAAGSPIAVNGGTGNDTVRVGNDADELTDLEAELTVNAGTGSDLLEVNDAGFATATTYAVSATEVTRGTVKVIYTAQAEDLELLTGTAANTINVVSTAAAGTGTSVTITGGPENDTINVGGGTLDGIHRAVTIDAGGSLNTLTVDDSGHTTDDQEYTISATEVTRVGSVAISYDEVSTLTVNAGKKKNTITVTGTDSAVDSFTVNGNEDEDTFDVTGAGLAAGSTNTFKGQGTGADAAADQFTVSPAVDAADPANDVIITVQGGEPAAAPDPTDKLIAKAFTTGVLASDDEDSSVSFPFEVAAGKPAKSPITFTGIEEVEFDAESVTPGQGGNNDVLLVTFTGANSGTFKVNNENAHKFKNSTQISWTGGNLQVVDTTTQAQDQTYDLSVGSITRGNVTITYSSTNVSVTGGTGNDTFTIEGNAVALTVDGGDGNDTINVGDGSLDAIAGTLVLKGGAGGPDSDTVVVDDADDMTDNTYLVTDSTVSRNGASPTINYADGFESVSVTGGTGNDAILVEASTAGISVAVDAGGGNDAVTLGRASSLASLAGPVNVVGGTGTDSLLLDDSAATGPGVYTIARTPTRTTVDRVGAATVSFATLETVALNTTAANDVIAVQSTPSGTQFTVNAGAGNDVVTVSSATGTLDDLDGLLTVNGGGQLDVLSISEVGATGPAGDTVSVYATGNRITGAAGGGWTVDTGADLFGGGINILTGAQPDTVNVVRTFAGAPLTINTWLGDDNVSVGGGLLTNLGGLPPVLVAGLGDIDTLTVNDANSTVAGIYAVTSADVSRIDGTPVSLPYFSQGFEQLVLKAGTQNDTILVQSTADLTPITVQGGAGADTVVAGELGTLDKLLAPLNVDGGAGDILVIDDSADADPNVYAVLATNVVRTNLFPIIINYSAVDQVALLGGFGSDSVTVAGTAVGTSVVVRPGAGDDSVAVGAGTLDNVLGPVLVDSGDGFDRLSVDDSANASPSDYDITSTQVLRSSGSPVSVDYFVDQLVLNAGSEGDTIDILSTAVQTVVNAGLGSDSVRVGGGSLDGLAGPVTFDAGLADVDTLTVDDSADTTNNNYRVTDLAVFRFDGGISFPYAVQGFEEVNLLAGVGADGIDVAATAAGVPVVVDGGAGDDVIQIGGGTLDGIRSAVGINGAGGVDLLVVDDSANGNVNDYTVTADEVNRGGSPAVAIGYGAMDQLRLLAGLADDTITVLSTSAAAPVAVLGGGGNDLVNVGGGTLDDLDGPLSPDGGAGTDTLVVDDSADDDANAYSIVDDYISRAGTPNAIPYNLRGFESVSLKAGTNNDSVDANNPGAGVPVSVDGGAGDDSFTLGFLIGAIRGGADDDTITGDNVARTYSIFAADAGAIGGILNAGFVQVENLIAGTADDQFLFTGGSLSGAVTGGAGRDTIVGDGANNTFHLTGPLLGSGKIDSGVNVLLGSFNTTEVLLGGAGNDELVVDDNAPANALARFDGQGDLDTVDFSDRSGGQVLSIRSHGLTGYELNGGTAADDDPRAIITEGVFGINRILGSANANTDTLADIVADPGPVSRVATWTVMPADGPEASSVQADTNLTRLEFDGFEQLVGSQARDTFIVQLAKVEGDSADDGFTSSLLIRGGTVPRSSGFDKLVVKGTDGDDRFKMLNRTQLWPNGTVLDMTPASVAGIQVDGHERVLYDLIEDLNLRGGAGNDTFNVDPGSKLPRFPRPRLKPNLRPLYGVETQSLTLQGETGADRFEVVPDRPGNKNPMPFVPSQALRIGGVNITVFGTSEETNTNQPDLRPTQGQPLEHDEMVLFRLAFRPKANFPLGDSPLSGPRSRTLWLWFVGYSPVKYVDMWKVSAFIADSAEGR